MRGAVPRKQVRGVSFKSGDFWIAVCLDHYLTTFARNEEDLRARICEMMATHIEASLELGQAPFANLPKAPEQYWRLWEKATSDKTVTPPDELFGPAFPELNLRTASAA